MTATTNRAPFCTLQVTSSQRPSALASHLVEQCAWGLMSPQNVQRLMALALEDLQAHRAGALDIGSVEALSAIGASGACVNNTYRDLQRKLSSPKLAEASFDFMLPMKSPLCKYVVQEYPQTVLLPHVMFSIMYQHHRPQFQTKFLGHSTALDDFWASQVGSPLVAEFPNATDPVWCQYSIPLAVHGDGTPVAGLGKAWGKMLDLYTMTSLLCTELAKDSLFYLFAVYAHLMTRDSTRAVWEILKWSFAALATGVWPSRDHKGERYPKHSPNFRKAGTPLAGGYRGILCCFSSDLDHNSKNLFLNHWASSRPCSHCPCTNVDNDPMCWAEFRKDRAQWQGECWSNAEWRALHPLAHPILCLSGIGIRHVFPDWMHTKHLGCDKVSYGSVMHLLCYELLPGTAEENCDQVWSECVAFYREHGIRDHYKRMKLSLFCKPRAPHANFPVMRGKAIEIRNLAQPLHHIWKARMTAGSTLHSQIEYMLRCSLQLENMIRTHRDKYCYPPPLAAEFRSITEKYLILMSAIARTYGESGRKLFDITTKHHILWHAADSSRMLSPSRTWCYKGEDGMMRVRRIASSCLTGTKHTKVGRKVLQKWCRGFTYRFSHGVATGGASASKNTENIHIQRAKSRERGVIVRHGTCKKTFRESHVEMRGA